MHSYVCICVCPCVNVEAGGEPQVSSLVSAHLSFLRQDLMLNLELTHLARLIGQETQGFTCQHPHALGLQSHATAPGFRVLGVELKMKAGILLTKPYTHPSKFIFKPGQLGARGWIGQKWRSSLGESSGGEEVGGAERGETVVRM